MTESDNCHGGTFTRWIAALSAATCNVRANAVNTGVHIKTSGNVGVGTQSPGTKLDVNGIIQSSTGTNAGEYRLGGSTIISASSGTLLAINQAGFSRVVIISGNARIGDTEPGSQWKFAVAGSGYFTGAVSYSESIDRTPYPKDLETAYAAVLSMDRLPPGEYDENDRENQIDHLKLHEFVRAQDGMGRSLSGTVSAQNEVIKDLLKRIEELEAKVN